MSDFKALLSEIQARVYNALLELTGSEPDVDDFNSRQEPRKVPYARVGIAEAAHTDFTVSSDSMMVGIQIVAVVDRNNRKPQEVQFELAEAIHKSIFGESYQACLLNLPSGRVARLIPTTKTTFLSDIEQAIAERIPDATSVVIVMTADIPLGGLVF